MLSSRQLAIVVWFVIFIIWALLAKQGRSALSGAVRVLVSPKIALSFAVIIGWNVAVVWGLYRVGFWNATVLYDTVLFVAVGGIGSVAKAATEGVTYDRRVFVRTILVNLEVIVLFAFLSDFFPFSFWVELILVVPFMTLLVMLVVVSEMQKGAERVHGFLSGTQAVIGLLLIGYVVWKVITEFHQLANPQVLFSLLLPFVMSVLFVPLLFLICTLMAYEDAFDHLAWCADDIKPLVRFKKWRLFLRFGLNTKRLQGFRRSRTFQDVRCSGTMEEARHLLTSWDGQELQTEPEYEYKGDD